MQVANTGILRSGTDLHMINVSKTYVCHWTKLSERKQYMQQHLAEAGINDVVWVENYDKNNWNEDEIRIDYPKAFNVMSIDNRKMRNSEISLALKHCWIIKDIFTHMYDSALILEDDVLLCSDFVNTFNRFKQDLPADWDCCWVGTCCNIHAEVIPGKNVYHGGKSRCTHAFMVSHRGAVKMLPLLSSLDAPADHFYNKLIAEANLNNFWFEPSLVEQRNDMFATSIHNET